MTATAAPAPVAPVALIVHESDGTVAAIFGPFADHFDAREWGCEKFPRKVLSTQDMLTAFA